MQFRSAGDDVSGGAMPDCNPRFLIATQIGSRLKRSSNLTSLQHSTLAIKKKIGDNFRVRSDDHQRNKPHHVVVSPVQNPGPFQGQLKSRFDDDFACQCRRLPVGYVGGSTIALPEDVTSSSADAQRMPVFGPIRGRCIHLNTTDGMSRCSCSINSNCCTDPESQGACHCASYQRCPDRALGSLHHSSAWRNSHQ